MKEIVIELSDEQYNAVLKDAGWVGNDLYHAVKNGTLLSASNWVNLDTDDLDMLTEAEKEAVLDRNLKGHWIEVEGENKCFCSRCFESEIVKYIPVEEKTNFCPICGADMR